MNDPGDPHHKLLAETLSGDWVQGPASAMARRAAAHARRRRSLRRVAVAVPLAVLLGFMVFVPREDNPSSTPATPAVAERGYEIISDDELIALLRDRPLLVLPEENGAKKVVVLDR